MLATPDSTGSLGAITKHSLFKTKEHLMSEFEALNNTRTGTRIILYNLKR